MTQTLDEVATYVSNSHAQGKNNRFRMLLFLEHQREPEVEAGTGASKTAYAIRRVTAHPMNSRPVPNSTNGVGSGVVALPAT